MGKTLPHPSKYQVDVIQKRSWWCWPCKNTQYPQHGENLRIRKYPSSRHLILKESWISISTSFQHCLRGNVPKLYHYSPVTFLNGKKKTLKTEYHHIERDLGQGRINYILAQILQNEVETPIIFKILIWSLLISAIVMESLIKGHAEAPRGNIKLGN